MANKTPSVNLNSNGQKTEEKLLKEDTSEQHWALSPSDMDVSEIEM